MINQFKDKNSYLSNSYMTYVYYDGNTYCNAESAYQAAKLSNKTQRQPFFSMNPKEAKRRGMRLSPREGWDKMRDQVMYEICNTKFQDNPHLLKKLLSTGDEELINTNGEGDTYWGVCRGKGENKLGKILMRIREENKKN